MKKFLTSSIVIAFLLLPGCALLFGGYTHEMKHEFYEAQTREALGKGPNILQGEAFLRQRGGGIVTCAGDKVYLIPATDYSMERMKAIYGSSEQGYQDFLFNNITFIPEEPRYGILQKTTVCNSQGHFKFNNIKDGAYYIIASVIWEVESLQGGILMKKIIVKNGEHKEVILSNNIGELDVF